MAAVRIHSSNICGWAIRNYAALLEKGVEFEVVKAHDDRGAKRKAFLELTPYGLTPVLEHGDLSIFESRIINEYIEDAFPTPHLMPSEAIGRALARKWMHYCDARLIPRYSKVALAKDSESQQAATMDAAEAVRYLDAHRPESSGGPYFFGADFSLVDLSYNTLFDLIQMLEDDGDKSSGFSGPMFDWRDAVKKRPSVIEAERMAGRLD